MHYNTLAHGTCIVSRAKYHNLCNNYCYDTDYKWFQGVKKHNKVQDLTTEDTMVRTNYLRMSTLGK